VALELLLFGQNCPFLDSDNSGRFEFLQMHTLGGSMKRTALLASLIVLLSAFNPTVSKAEGWPHWGHRNHATHGNMSKSGQHGHAQVKHPKKPKTHARTHA
jgi:hypothetical protein